MTLARSFVLLALAAPILDTSALAQCPRGKVVPLHAPASHDALGAVVDVEGALGLVGSPGDDEVLYNSGAAYVFDTATGAVLHKLTPEDPSSSKRFGTAVAIEGTLGLVGADLDQEAGFNAGAVYVFDLGTGLQLAKWTAPDPQSNHGFGRTLALRGGVALVGAPGDNDLGTSAGSVYVFDAATGSVLRELHAANGAAGDGLGTAVALDGGRAVVGAAFADTHAEDSGTVVSFDVATGLQLLEFPATGVGPNGYFGYRLDADQGRVVAPRGADTVHVFDATTGVELAVHTFAAEVPGAVAPVAIAGDRAVLGQYYDPGVVENAGRALVLDLATGAVLATITAADGFEYDSFGYALAFEGERVFVGAPASNNPLPDSGALYLFELCPAVGGSYCGPAVPNSTGLPGTITALGNDIAAENDLFLLAADLPPGRFGYFLTADAQDFVVGPGGSQGNLCLGGKIGRFASLVASTGLLGRLQIEVDLTALPTAPPHAVQAGETWNFQAWHRDQNPTATSNFTDAVAVLFQ